MLQITKWFKSNKLCVNLEKQIMLFSTKHQLNNKHELLIKVDDLYLEQVSHSKYFGIWIDDKLNWKYHIAQLSNKLSKIVGLVKEIMWTLGKNSLTQLYYTLAYPHLIYCNVVWAANYITNSNSIMIIQKKLVRIINLYFMWCIILSDKL